MILLIPSYSIAQWLLEKIDIIINLMGFPKNSLLEEFLYTIIVLCISGGIGWIIKYIFQLIIRLIFHIKHFTILNELISLRVISRCSHIVPPLVILAFIPFVFENEANISEAIRRLSIVYLLITIAIGLCSILSFLWMRYDTYKNTRNLPLRGVLNVCKGIVWIVILIVSVSVLIDKSPTVLLTGLGAFAAALMLIFKDSILGFVAGIQISQNDMLHVGDWVIVPGTIANGIVIDVTLSVVKIRNWDNTIVMLPPYSLVSSSFQNWRGMSDSGVRLISRSILIDNGSIKAATPDLISEIQEKLPVFADFISQSGSATIYNNGVAVINGTTETNLGLLRAYACQYIISHPMVASDKQILVRLMEGDATGTPLQLYCFATTTDWTLYEAIQSEIVEHIISICPTFHIDISDSTYVPT
ncbi:MAG: mechanosensitive ion channel [Muribaculaceae bacterium]|nr:mechanosensitive ion channel [Muribaculaceae bacterium]